MLLAAVMAGVMSVGVGEARGQSLQELWNDPYRLDLIGGEDAAVALTSFAEGAHRYVFVTGWGTNTNGGSCIMTYKLDATTGDRVGDVASIPPTGYLSTQTVNKPTAITVDYLTGDVFVTGYSQRSQGGDFDYIDVRAVAMDTAFHGTTEVAYVAGWLLSPVSSEVPMYYMTLKYTIYPTMVIDASDFLPSPHALEAKARDVHAGFEGPAGVLKGVFVTGRQGFTSSGIDHVTVGYSP